MGSYAPIRLPEFVLNVLNSFEQQTSPFNEAQVYDALANARKSLGDLSESDFEGLRAEASAFFFYERRNGDSVWGTYFAPTFTATTKDGQQVRNPDITQLGPPVIEHWQSRAKATKNPVLRARYADLVWDLSKPITGNPPDVEFARIAIDSYLEAVEQRFHTIEIESIQWLQRALDPSLGTWRQGTEENQGESILYEDIRAGVCKFDH